MVAVEVRDEERRHAIDWKMGRGELSFGPGAPIDEKNAISDDDCHRRSRRIRIGPGHPGSQEDDRCALSRSLLQPLSLDRRPAKAQGAGNKQHSKQRRRRSRFVHR
jgi:hypothetical protein